MNRIGNPKVALDNYSKSLNLLFHRHNKKTNSAKEGNLRIR